LGPILQHLDDIDSIRCLFLQSRFEFCNQLIEPPLLAVTPAGFVQVSQAPCCMFGLWHTHTDTEVAHAWQLPLETLALQSNIILYLDHGTDVFVWSGRDTKDAPQAEELRQQCVTYFYEQTASRFPSPYFMSFKEGDSMARWLLCRLIPSHKDPVEIQEKFFPSV
jgi:hypothetical protein